MLSVQVFLKLLEKIAVVFPPNIKGDFGMKNMQNFYKGLTSVTETSMPQQRRLALLTRLDRTQLLKAASDLTWDIWSVASTAAVS